METIKNSNELKHFGILGMKWGHKKIVNTHIEVPALDLLLQNEKIRR